MKGSKEGTNKGRKEASGESTASLALVMLRINDALLYH